MPYTPAQIKQRFGLVTDRNDPNPALHYQVMTPLNWLQVDLPGHLVTPAQPVQLQCWLKSTTGPKAEIKVTIIYTPDETDPADWLTTQLEKGGEHILHSHFYSLPTGRQPDLLTISTKPGIKRVSRWVLLKDGAPRQHGAHLFLLQASTEEINYTQEMADVFGMAVNNFDILHSTKWDFAEPLRTLVRTVPAQVSTVFPLSWQQQENPSSNEHFYQVKFSKEEAGRRIGMINLMLTAGQSLAQMKELVTESNAVYRTEQLDFTAATLVPTPSFGLFQEVYTAVTQQTNATPSSPVQERQLMLARAGTYWVLLENTRFTREADPEAWAISKRQAVAVAIDLADPRRLGRVRFQWLVEKPA
ncbi:MAG: hypothetical protein EOO56_02255 [Hymenobacter sp.]|nr:MAG: hypothetical protein EOO56_02255 [Hymenobacter sp.]